MTKKNSYRIMYLPENTFVHLTTSAKIYANASDFITLLDHSTLWTDMVWVERLKRRLGMLVINTFEYKEAKTILRQFDKLFSEICKEEFRINDSEKEYYKPLFILVKVND